MSFIFRNILVTGGAGFIGSHFILYALKKYGNIKIINLDKLTYAANLNHLDSVEQHTNYHFIQGDIGEAAQVTHLLLKYEIDTLINFAAETHVDRSIVDPFSFIHNNIQGTHHLLHCALQYWQKKFSLDPQRCRFHQISTDEVYGSLQMGDPAFAEHSPYQPNSPYAASKAAADHLVQAYHKTYGLPITISNCSNNYGNHQHREKLIPKIIQCCIEQQPIPLYKDGKNIRDWIFVEDHCNAIDHILQYGKIGQRYNVGGKNEMTNLHIAQLICKKMDPIFPENAPHERLITFVKDRPGHDFRYAINSQLLESTTGWRPSTRLDAMLHHLIHSKIPCYAN